jgi:3-oxoacyl-[acyl-carrier-protein] synthase III
MEMHKALKGVKILDTATSFPDKNHYYSNNDLHEIIYGKNWKNIFEQKKMDLDFYEKEFGFRNRYLIKNPGQQIIGNEITSSDLMVIAGKKLLKRNPLVKKKITFLIAVTTTSDKYTTSMGAVTASKLNLNCASIEIKAGCASGLYAMLVASQYIQVNGGLVLILSGETLSKIASESYYYACGDAGAAILLGETKSGSGIIFQQFETRGEFSDQMGIRTSLPPTGSFNSKTDFLFYSNKKMNQIFLDKWKTFPNIVLSNSKIKAENIISFISNQPNKKFIEEGVSSIGLEFSKAVIITAKYANCGQSGFFLALDYSLNRVYYKKGDIAFLFSIGGGMNSGGIIWRF